MSPGPATIDRVRACPAHNRTSAQSMRPDASRLPGMMFSALIPMFQQLGSRGYYSLYRVLGVKFNDLTIGVSWLFMLFISTPSVSAKYSVSQVV